MPTIPNKDLTFRVSSSGDAPLASDTEHVLNTAQRLFFMTRGTDIYDKDMGLDIIARKRTSYIPDTRDSTYEQMVLDQFNKYTDIIITTVICTYRDEMLVVDMVATYNSIQFRLRITSDPETLSSQITRIMTV